ncbi:hypothetical protein [Saccharibacillus deserti]|uniref:hypothetical protein n=1 Tax=Saccharibacillus deserti TaxID=1634444 RepID=UPI001553857B|nr:hypothetical protein [Saccharibacillus deserti]
MGIKKEVEGPQESRLMQTDEENGRFRAVSDAKPKRKHRFLQRVLAVSLLAGLFGGLLTACREESAAPETHAAQEQGLRRTSSIHREAAADEDKDSSVKPAAVSTKASGVYQAAGARGVKESALIPYGWHKLKQPNGAEARVQGDMNRDGVPDLAIVIERDAEEGESPPRSLLLAFGRGGETFSLSVIAEHTVLSQDEGGVWGDPFHGLTIERGTVVIRHYGGSNDRWYRTDRFRYQEKDWKLIGITTGSFFTGTQTEQTADEADYNLVTGDYSIKKTDDKGRRHEQKGNQGKRELTKIEEFDIEKRIGQTLYQD